MLIFKVLLALSWNLLLFGALLFLPAGTLDWGRAWVFLGVGSACIIAVVIGAFRDNEELWNERLKPLIQPEQPLTDKIILSLFVLTLLGLILFIPIDIFQFHLLGKPTAIVSGLGLLFFIAGWWIILLSFKENTFAAPVVKHQVDRGQTVIDTGVYRIVRHPFYAGAVLLLIGMPLWLESYAATLFAIAPIFTLVIRIIFEEQFLREKLEGYDAYLDRVRYRLVPYLW